MDDKDSLASLLRLQVGAAVRVSVSSGAYHRRREHSLSNGIIKPLVASQVALQTTDVK
jgi:hypothetical protein